MISPLREIELWGLVVRSKVWNFGTGPRKTSWEKTLFSWSCTSSFDEKNIYIYISLLN